MAILLGAGVAVGVTDLPHSGLYGWFALLMTASVAYLAYYSFRLQKRHTREMTGLHLRTIEALAIAMRAKDDASQGHVRRVALYTEALGKELNLPASQVEALRAAALLYDIGKLAIPDYIIAKPGALTEEEFERMKIHTVVGAAILERVGFPYPVAPIVRSHHERWDGGGYPDGLKEEQIPLGARILAVADSFAALIADRPYRRALPQAEAVTIIRKQSGSAYDPRIVDVLERLWPELEAKLATPSEGAPAVPQGAETAPGLGSISEARQELQVLFTLAQGLGNSLSVEETLRLVCAELRKLIPFDAAIGFVSRDCYLIPRFWEGVQTEALSQFRIPIGEGLSGWAAAHSQCLLNGNPAADRSHLRNPTGFARLQSALAAPLDSPQGNNGVLTLYSMQPAAFTTDHLRILKSVAGKMGAAIHNALAHEAIRESAHTDDLTGLPNSRALFQRINEEAARADRHCTVFTIFVVDLNELKRINDTLGHLTGNEVIAAVARALRGCLREYDFAARLGGDEFVILLPGLGPEDAAEKRLDLRAAVEALRGEFPRVEISVSMGSASYPADGRQVDQLVSLADKRMYWHKRQRYATRTSGVPA
jgi:diguanylate cyclase (GGDEF)-like protein/putative nucleotidyltransferase with HDIG domain